jgi:NADP-dependent 3-hydroxy acid dehydrogenase YdfG
MIHQSRNESRSEVIVITGASAGVGRAMAQAFARPGAKIALLARGNDGLAVACAEVEAAGDKGLVLSVDVANATALMESSMPGRKMKAGI